MEYVYKLNLPSIEYFLHSEYDFKSKIVSSITNIYKLNSIFDITKLNFNEYDWRGGSAVIFKKTPFSDGVVHIDGLEDSKIFGINWIHGGDGGMKYWSNPKHYKMQSTILDNAGRPRIDIQINSPHDKIYPMECNCAYLVNTSVPHSGYNKHPTESRYAISLRPKNKKIEWKEVVNSMKHLIVSK
ncbi:MAG: hypothetical protein RLZZ196_2816 [Bacteroidota bacterium]|jgi:hypothetical protein